MIKEDNIEEPNLYKRGEGKIKIDIGVSDMYHMYRKRIKHKHNFIKANYSQYAYILGECNKKIKSLIIDDSEIVKLPFKLGYLHVSKIEATFFNPNYWPIDFKKSKEIGEKVLIMQEFFYPMKWTKSNNVHSNKKRYKFIACRDLNRDKAYNIKVKKIDYYL